MGSFDDQAELKAKHTIKATNIRRTLTKITSLQKGLREYNCNERLERQHYTFVIFL